ncbi:MAG: hypothetical protein ACI8YQ_000382 [Polaribacter sp.]|jgi:hypothetical protein
MDHKEIEKYKLELKEVPLESAPADHRKINCSSCGNHIPADNININDKIAKCNNCNVVFSFQNEIASLLKREKTKQEVLRPEGIDIFYFQEDLDIVIKQPMTALEVIGLSLLPLFVFVFGALFFKGKIGMMMPIITGFLSVILIGNLFMRSKHKVHLSVGRKFLSIKWRPRKFYKDQFYPIQEIDQIYVKNVAGQYTIYMILNGADGQKHVPLISGIDSMSKARYLEQEIEYHLGIEDREVPEES